MLILGLLAVALVPSALRAQDKPKPETEKKVLETKDGWKIAITYYPCVKGKPREAPVVILLHQRGGNRLIWKNGFAKRLQQNGFAAISVDLRKHGQSTVRADVAGFGRRKKKGSSSTELRSADYKLMVRYDLEAVKRFIREEHLNEKLNMRKTAIVAPEMSAPLAINYALYDWRKLPYDDSSTRESRTPRGQDIRALVLLSPTRGLSGLNTGAALTELANPVFGVAFLVCYGTQDKLDKGAGRKMYLKLTAKSKNKDRMYRKEYDLKLRGTDLLGRNTDVEKLMVRFLEKHLKDLPDQWVNRRSGLE